VQTANSHYNLPDSGQKIAYKASREGVADRFPELAVQKNIEVDLALIPSDDEVRSALALSILNTAQQHDAPTLYLWPTVPGIGKILSLVRRYDSHDIARVPRGQDCVS
jgi:hypothetical protein